MNITIIGILVVFLFVLLTALRFHNQGDDYFLNATDSISKREKYTADYAQVIEFRKYLKNKGFLAYERQDLVKKYYEIIEKNGNEKIVLEKSDIYYQPKVIKELENVRKTTTHFYTESQFNFPVNIFETAESPTIIGFDSKERSFEDDDIIFYIYSGYVLVFLKNNSYLVGIFSPKIISFSQSKTEYRSYYSEYNCKDPGSSHKYHGSDLFRDGNYERLINKNSLIRNNIYDRTKWECETIYKGKDHRYKENSEIKVGFTSIATHQITTLTIKIFGLSLKVDYADIKKSEEIDRILAENK